MRWHLDLDTLTDRDRLGCERLILTHQSPTALALDLTEWDTARKRRPLPRYRLCRW